MELLVTTLVVLAALLLVVRPAWGFCGYLAALIIRPNELYDLPLPAVPLLILAAGLSILLHLGRALPRPPGPRPWSPTLMVLLLLLLFVSLLRWHRYLVMEWLLTDAVQFIILLHFLTRHLSTPERLSTHFSGLMVSASVIAVPPFFIHFFTKGALRTIYDREGNPMPGYGDPWDRYHLFASRLMGRAGTAWGNPNALAMVTNWAIPGVLYHLRRQGSALLKLPFLCLLGLLIGTLLLTGSRTGQLQLGVTLWMVFIGGKRKALGLLLLGLSLTAVLVVIPRLAPERQDAAASATERGLILGAAIQMFKESPIMGIGFLSFHERNSRKLQPHNAYMQSLTETGLIGAAIFFPLIFLLRRETSRAVKHFEGADDGNLGALARAIGALQLGYTILLFFSNNFMTFNFAIVMVTAVSLHVTMLRHRAARPESSPTTAPDGSSVIEVDAAPPR